VTLRADIHEVFDEVAPPAPMLAWKAESYVSTQASMPPRRRIRGWTRPLRGTLGFVAAALLLVLLAGVFLGGRYWRDLHAVPQPVHTPTLKDLEKRPLLFVNLEPGAECPTSPIKLTPGGLAVGDGPVYFIDRNPGSESAWGSWQQLRFGYVDQGQGPGIVLMRGWDIGSNHAVAFAQDPLGPSRIIAAGQSLGSDQIVDKKVQRRSEAYFVDPAHSPPGLYPLVTVMVGVPKGASGCVGLQFDHAHFTENFVISWSHIGL
jgi:hypothetical protein